ncbi:MAG: dTMP kinase [Synergistaceae bacterium]|nr:dTMP kinase [Synergistaceae bacterium]
MAMSRGLFFTFEGIDGCGKSTQACLLYKRLTSRRGEDSVVWTREPGGWDGGEKIRELLLERGTSHAMSELFLFMADRCEHASRVINPALDAGKTVLCERYTDSTIAYQSWGGGIPLSRIEEMFNWCSFPVPDLTFFIDIGPEAALERVVRRGRPDFLEKKGASFLERVREGFVFLSEREPERIVRLDGGLGIESLAGEIGDKAEVLLHR